MPFFLAENPDVVVSLTNYCRRNLTTLSVESVYSHIHETIIPELVKKIANEKNDPTYNKQQLLTEFRVKNLTLSTVYRWMLFLGFKFEPRRKCYYVDNHESPENISYQNLFIDRYFSYESRCYRWLSITEEEKEAMVSKGKIHKDLGYHYTNSENTKLVKFHIDYHVQISREM